MSNKVYPKGIRVFNPKNTAQDYVKGQIVITIDELNDFVNENRRLLGEYNGNAQLKLNLLSGRDGLYLTVDTYKK